MIAILTPPVGAALFVIASAGRNPFRDLATGILPFLLPLVSAPVLLILWPVAGPCHRSARPSDVQPPGAIMPHPSGSHAAPFTPREVGGPSARPTLALRTLRG